MTDKELKARAAQAKADQAAKMAAARTALEAFWAGSASASVAHHVARGAVRVLEVEGA